MVYSRDRLDDKSPGEEVNIIRRGGNYGWNLREGKHPSGPGGSDISPKTIEPIWEYGRLVGKSITGGHVYHGTSAPSLKGGYLYADFVSGRIWALWYDTKSAQVTANRPIRNSGPPIITFGEDDQGEQYYSTQTGQIYKFQ
jgi:glucose/arabinose dehydrogenase